MKLSARLFVVVLVMAVFSLTAMADIYTPVNVTINNASFENPALAPGAFTIYSVPGWNLAPGTIGGVYSPLGVINPNAADGNNALWLSSGSASQTLDDTLAPWTNYTLTTYVGQRSDFSTIGFNYTISLFAGDTLLASVSGGSPGSGTWGTSTLFFSTNGTNDLFGAPLTIQLANTGDPQVLFDNVSLVSVDPPPSPLIPVDVPEPGTLGLLGTGLVSLAGVVRRYGRKS